MNTDFDAETAHHLEQVRKLETKPGIYTASVAGVVTGYDKAWLRDIYFMTLGFLESGDVEQVRKSAKALLQVFVKHKDKIDWAIENRPHETWQHIHARFHPETFDEFWEEWGNKQHDAVGEVLNLIVEMERRGASVVETDEERAMTQKIIHYLCNLEYWQDPDNGIWEENVELHASSVGSVVAALKKAREIDWLEIPDGAIEKGEEALRNLLPRESHDKFADLALLSLVYPFRVTTDEETNAILRNVEYHLVRDKGLIRYKFDRYFNANEDGYSEEAEWSFGLSWLAIIYAERGMRDRAEYYLRRAQDTITNEGEIPELYYSHTDTPNENTPLGWAESMYVVALVKVRDM